MTRGEKKKKGKTSTTQLYIFPYLVEQLEGPLPYLLFLVPAGKYEPYAAAHTSWGSVPLEKPHWELALLA